jgi:hypothetical protein
VVLLGRVGCHLCDEARAVVADVCAALDVEWVERDVDADPDLRRRWSDFVPVVLVDSVEHARYRVDAASLRRALL